jgi:phytanoyl-CoA hydroxylase
MLDQAQVDSYHQNGYLLVKGLLSADEALQYRTELHDLFDRLYSTAKQGDATWGSVDNKNATRLQHCHDVQFYNAVFTRLICDPRLTEATAALMGTQNVQLHHTKAFIKPPEKGSPFPMHQDAPFFPHARHSMIAAIIHFDDAFEKKGCVRVMPGSHKDGRILPHIEQGNFHLDKEAYPIDKAMAVPAQAGDVLFLSYLLIHGSGVNESDEARSTLLVQMRDPEDSPTKHVHESRGQGMMLRGINPTSGNGNLPSSSMISS